MYDRAVRAGGTCNGVVWGPTVLLAGWFIILRVVDALRLSISLTVQLYWVEKSIFEARIFFNTYMVVSTVDFS